MERVDARYRDLRNFSQEVSRHFLRRVASVARTFSVWVLVHKLSMLQSHHKATVTCLLRRSSMVSEPVLFMPVKSLTPPLVRRNWVSKSSSRADDVLLPIPRQLALTRLSIAWIVIGAVIVPISLSTTFQQASPGVHKVRFFRPVPRPSESSALLALGAASLYWRMSC